MSEYTKQDTGTLKVTIREGAIERCVQRGSLDKDLGSGSRVYVYLDLT
jgi:hypothetical protein